MTDKKLKHCPFCYVMESGIMTRDQGNFLEQRMHELGIECD